MICKNCNNEIPEGGYFCPKCGTRCQEGDHPLLKKNQVTEVTVSVPAEVKAEAVETEETKVVDSRKLAAKVGLIGGTKRFFKNRHKCKMRASRSEFWWGLVGALIHWGIVGMIKMVLGPDNFFVGILGFLLMLPIYIGFVTLNIRRLHDTGSKGHWFWFILLPVIGWIILIVKCSGKSDDENKWGVKPIDRQTRKQRKAEREALKIARKAEKKKSKEVPSEKAAKEPVTA